MDATGSPTKLRYWLLSLWPVGLLWLAFHVSAMPDALRTQMVDITDDWAVSSEDQPSFADARFDDSTWKRRRFSGAFPDEEFPGQVVWLRKRIRVPDTLAGPASVVFANRTSGAAQTYFDGKLIGTTATRSRLDVGDLFVPEHHRLPEREGTLAIRTEWGVVGDKANNWPRIELAPTGALEAHYERIHIFRRFFTEGVLFASPFLLAVVLLLRKLETDALKRRASAGLVFAILGLASLALIRGTWSPLASNEPHWIVALGLSGVLISGGYFQFIQAFVLRNDSPRQERLSWALGGTVWAASFLGSFWMPEALLNAYLVLAVQWVSLFLLIPIQILVKWKRTASSLTPIFFSASLLFAVCFVSDLLVDLVGLPDELSSFGTPALPILCVGVLAFDFSRVYEVNRKLRDGLSVTNRNLETALVEARESSRIKSEFVTNISHELRTPLNTVINLPEAMATEFSSVWGCSACGNEFSVDAAEVITLETPCPECGKTSTLAQKAAHVFTGDAVTTVQRLNRIAAQGRALLTLVDNVLKFSSLEAGKAVARVVELQANELLASVAVEYQQSDSAKEKKIRIEVSPADETLLIVSDPQLLREALAKVVDNALKFSPVGAAVELSAEKLGEEVALRVVDHGEGIPAGQHEGIFESFRQIDGGLTRKHGGVGLGLSIARALLAAQRSRITVESAPQQGATFSLIVPAA